MTQRNRIELMIEELEDRFLLSAVGFQIEPSPLVDQSSVVDSSSSTANSEPATQSGRISGRVWEDLNADGTWDPDEPVQGNWEIHAYVDSDNDGQLSQSEADAGPEAETLTDTQNGFYGFKLNPGNYIVVEKAQPYWFQSFPTSVVTSATGLGSQGHAITLASGEVSRPHHFLNYAQGLISGRKWEDLNANGALDPGESVQGGLEIHAYLDQDNDGRLSQTEADAGPEAKSWTDPQNGFYGFRVDPGNYIVVEKFTGHWYQSFPASEVTDVRGLSSRGHVVELESRELDRPHHFLNYRKGRISGRMWEDLNADGERNPGEPVRGGWEVRAYLDLNNDGQLSQAETNLGPAATDLTDPANGFYALKVDPGNYIVVEERWGHWSQSFPNDVTTTVGDVRSRGHVVQVESGEAELPHHFLNFRDENPDWYDENRTQAHTRLWMGGGEDGFLDTPESDFAAEGVAGLGANVLSRHVLTGWEDPWWPSAAPLGPDGERLFDDDRVNQGTFVEAGRDIPQEFIDEANANGVTLIAYYWIMSDASIAEEHPEWVCRDVDGNIITHPNRGDYIDITSFPYRETVAQRFLELAAKGYEGVFLDHVHLPSFGCFDTPLEDAFVAETGLSVPVSESDPLFTDWIDFKAKEIEETIGYWIDYVRAQFPDFQFIISTQSVPALLSRQMTTKLASLGIPKNEYFHGLRFDDLLIDPDAAYVPPDDLIMAYGWTLLRDTSERAPRIGFKGLPDSHHALAFASSLMTYGAVANMDVAEENVLVANDPPGKTSRAALEDVFQLGAAVSPHLADSSPLRWVAVHFSESARNTRSTTDEAWDEVVSKSVGAFSALTRAGQSAGIVTDWQLKAGQLDDYKFLFLPNPSELTGDQLAAVSYFQQNGGVVIENDPDWNWNDATLFQTAADDFLGILHSIQSAPVTVSGGPEMMHSVSYVGTDSQRLAVAITNEFDWVQIVSRNRPVPPGGVNDPAPLVGAGVEISWEAGRGLPDAGTIVAHDAVSGNPLTVEPTASGYRIVLPQFDKMVLAVIEFA